MIPSSEARKRWGQAQGHHGQVGSIASGKKRRELKATQSVEVVHKVGGVWNFVMDVTHSIVFVTSPSSLSGT